MLTPPFKIAIVRRYDVYLMFLNPIDETIISIGAGMVASQPFPSLISCNPKGDPIAWTELLQLTHNAGCDDGCSLRQ
jgi:hypothetical protein